MSAAGARSWLQGALVVACFIPLLWLVQAALRGGLGANPIKMVTHVTGEWALRLLLTTLAITPLRTFTGWRQLAPFRRTLGLCAFAYVCLHLATYVGFDLGFAFSLLGEDLVERPYITIGMAALLLLMPLAMTSTLPSARLRARTASPSMCARCSVEARKPTPWTRPLT